MSVGTRVRRAPTAVATFTAAVWAFTTMIAAGSAQAAPTSQGWAQWSDPAGVSHEFHGTMQLPAAGFPSATWTSDSRAPVQLPTGSSTYLPASSPPGARYGSSQGNAYLNLRPYADNATSPSTTTFDFAAATPTAGWSFVLGDIDADRVHLAARDADGLAVPVSDIDRWEQGAFNYAGGTDRPTWQPDTATLTGNPTASDTKGASDWFTPDRALSSLTFTFTQRSGFPVYQIWFATQSHTVSGTVTGTTRCPATGATVRLLGPDRTELSNLHPHSDGTYTFAGYAAQPGYTVAVDAPDTPTDGCEVTTPTERTVDLTDADGTADFALRDVVPQPVAGTVTTTGGDPVPDVTVTLSPPAGSGDPTRTTTTDDTGRYLFDNNRAGTGYRVSVAAPPGYTVEPPAQRSLDITLGQAVPDQDFVLRARPTVSGTVSDSAGPVEAVPVTLTDAAGAATHTVTDAAGQFRVDRVEAGTYSISVTPPPGYARPPDRTDVTVATTDVTGQDFTLSRLGTVAGTVSHNATPLPDVTVTVTGPDGDRRTRTASDGTYRIDGLRPATYTVTVTPPIDYHVAGSSSLTAIITDAGELRGGLDFTVVPTSRSTTPTITGPPTITNTPTTAVPTTGSSAPTGVPGGSSSPTGAAPTAATSSPPSLAATGAEPSRLAFGAVALLLLGTVLLAAARRPSRRRH